jgi:hypothetical protein
MAFVRGALGIRTAGSPDRYRAPAISSALAPRDLPGDLLLPLDQPLDVGAIQVLSGR